MRTVGFVIVGLLAISCSGTMQDSRDPSAPARDLRREADRGDVSARPETGGGAPALACGDTVLNDQATSGGEQLTHLVPCAPVPVSLPPPVREDLPARGDAPAATPDAQPGGGPQIAKPEPAKPKKKGPAIQATLPAKK